MSQTFVGSFFSTITGLIRKSVADFTWQAYEQVWREWHDRVSNTWGCFNDKDRLHVLLYFLGKNCKRCESVASVNRKMSRLAFFVQNGGGGGCYQSFYSAYGSEGLKEE